MRKQIQECGGLKKVTFAPFRDFRGELLKLYRRELFTDLLPNIEEIYLSQSRKWVVRGLHFQLGSNGQDKFIYCISGRLLDLSVDLRLNGNFGRVHVEELVGRTETAILVPAGFAHGVIALEDDTTFLNMSPHRYSPGDERGVRWDSLGIDFHIPEPVITEKDRAWPTLAEVLAEMRSS